VLVSAGSAPANAAYLDVAAGQGDADLVDLGTVKVLLGLVVCLPLASKRACVRLRAQMRGAYKTWWLSEWVGVEVEVADSFQSRLGSAITVT
jgi:hypothetical protein